MQEFFCAVGKRDVRAFDHELRLQAVHVVFVHHVRARSRDPDVALDIDHVVARELLRIEVVGHALALVLELDQPVDIETVRVVDRAVGVRDRDQDCALLRQVAGRVLADRAEALHHQAGAFEFEVAVVQGHVDHVAQAETGGADFVQRDAADFARQADHAADLVPNPGHAFLVGTHVGGEDIGGLVAQRVRKRADQLLLLGFRHFRVAVEHQLAAAVGEPGCSVFIGHRARQAHAFFGADVGCHAHAADRRALGDVVDHEHGLEVHRRLVDMNDFQRAEFIGEFKDIFQLASLISNE